jgi:exopolyphosphatase/guanosine-5'-triphosphate,3'-diphosphate pyrophosphatase
MKVGATLAAIDIGTHSVRMLLGTYDGHAVKGEKQLVITKLGEGLAFSHRLAGAAIARTAKAVEGFVAMARARGAVPPVYAYATSAAREAENGKELLDRLAMIEGLETEIIDGDAEALLAYCGAAKPGEVVMDIGGGSTELSRKKGDAFLSRSVPFGTVTALERALSGGKRIDTKTVLAMTEYGRPLVQELCHTVMGSDKAETLVGVGGTATQLAMLFLGLPSYDPGRVQGFAMPLSELDHLQEKLVSLTTQQRRELPGMHLDRADVIVAGCLIARLVMAESGAHTLVSSDLDGLDAYLFSKLR